MSKNCFVEQGLELAKVMGYEFMDGNELFLGNPLFVKGNRCNNFNFIIDKVFRPSAADVILNWRIEDFSDEDRLVWRNSPNGIASPLDPGITVFMGVQWATVPCGGRLMVTLKLNLSNNLWVVA
uniref:Uncharacterized protein n=1 Tax=Cannabis sativa TaxID=3483 RepID=A0A803NSK8_CANSA